MSDKPVFRSSKTHHIVLMTSGNGDRCEMWYLNEKIGESSSPCRASAKILLGRGVASMFDTIQCWRGATPSLYGNVGKLLTSDETT